MKRRDFIKILGAGAATTAVAACTDKTLKAVSSRKEPGEMTYRQNPKGVEVSLLGYGCKQIGRAHV